jgi:biotin synthase-like enzyme
MQKTTCFERAIFLSWYCKRGDCKFCYMYTQKDKIKNPKLAKRTKESILAEAIISKNQGWEIEFISGGYESYDFDDIIELVKNIYLITGKKQWLNIGTLSEGELLRLKPYTEGFCGAVECVNKKVHDYVCPSKPVKDIEECYALCDKLGLKKAMTLVIGIGESMQDFDELRKFIIKNRISRITFYSLNPHRGTVFDKSPDIKYYSEWVLKTRQSFPNLHIIAGAWKDKAEYYSELLKAGADNITKFPAVKYFGTKEAEEVERQAKLAGRGFIGSMTDMPDADWDKEINKLDLGDKFKEKIKVKVKEYVKQMMKNK